MKKEGIKELKIRLLELLKKEALRRGRFVLSSGKISNYYLDGRLITLSPEGAYLAASIILEIIKGKKIDAVGGPTLGADPIVGAIACLSYIKRIPVTTFIVREAVKGHGMKRQIEGPLLKKKNRVLLVDDVATTGDSLIEAGRALSKIGVHIDRAIVIVDRGEGARQNLAKRDIKLESIFNIKDFGF